MMVIKEPISSKTPSFSTMLGPVEGDAHTYICLVAELCKGLVDDGTKEHQRARKSTKEGAGKRERGNTTLEGGVLEHLGMPVAGRGAIRMKLTLGDRGERVEILSSNNNLFGQPNSLGTLTA